MLSRFNKEKKVPLKSVLCKKFFGYEPNEIMQIADRFALLCPTIDYFKQDKEFSEGLSVDITKLKEFIDEKLNVICSKMLDSYLVECEQLVQDFLNYKVSVVVDVSVADMSLCISSPQTISQLFRIFYKYNKKCYCTIADAILDNQEQQNTIDINIDLKKKN